MKTDALGAKVVPLLRRPLQPDEWPESYLAAVVRENGVRRPWIYHVDQIRSLLPWYRVGGRDTDCIDRLTSPYARDGWPNYGQATLPRWAGLQRSSGLRYCPLCMLKSRYVRTRWRLPGLQVCTLHGCFLKSDVAEPALTTIYKRDGLLHLAEATDEDLLAEAVCCMPDQFRVVRKVWGALEVAAEKSPLPFTDDALGQLAGWTVLAWRLVDRVAGAHVRHIRKTISRGALADAAQLFRDVELTIAPHREGIRAFLHCLTENVHYKAALGCLRRLVAAEEIEPTVLGRLPLAHLHDGLVAAAPQLAVMTKAGQIVFREERERALSRNQVKEELGVNDLVINRWIRTGVFRNVEVRQLGAKRFVFISREDVRMARRNQLSLIYVEEFLDEHGVDWPTYFALSRSRLIAPVRVGDRRYLSRGALSDLSARLELLSAPADQLRGPQLPLFSQASVRLARSTCRFGDFVHAALAGRIAVFRDLGKPGLSAFMVGTEGITWLRRRARSTVTAATQNVERAQVQLFEAAA
jgi:hypothetical protein